MEINISNILSSNSAIFHDEGILVYNIIEKELKDNKKVLLSFEKLDDCSTQFLNASLGKLYINFSPKFLDTYLSLRLSEKIPLLERKIVEVKNNALNHGPYDKIIQNAISSR